MPTIKTEVFDCDIRLGGNIMHAVPRKGVTQQEMRLLKLIHGGNDAVVNVKKVGELDVDEFQLNMQLAFDYGKERVEKAFGISLDLYDIWKEERKEKEELEREAKRIENLEEQKRLQALKDKAATKDKVAA